MTPAGRDLIAELDEESRITRRVLERVPEDRLEWRPHPKSLTLGQLAQHIALIPGSTARMVRLDGIDMATRRVEYASPESAAAVLSTLDASVGALREVLSELDERSAGTPWRMMFGDREVMAVPRAAVLRRMAFNHWYHHRGELVVYLRLLGVPVPVVYGKSADENPFAELAGVARA